MEYTYQVPSSAMIRAGSWMGEVSPTTDLPPGRSAGRVWLAFCGPAGALQAAAVLGVVAAWAGAEAVAGGSARADRARPAIAANPAARTAQERDFVIT